MWRRRAFAVGPFDMRDPDSGEVRSLMFDSMHLTLPEHAGQVLAFRILTPA